LSITAEFVRSASGAADCPNDGLPEVALVGRSNVGKSSLINALVGRRVARTSAAPGKTRLANIYWIQRGTATALYLVDLPGYGYARGGEASARDFEVLTGAYFGRRARKGPERQEGGRQRLRPSRGEDTQIRSEGSASGRAGGGAPVPVRKRLAGLLLVDSRHPGLQKDAEAWSWLRTIADEAAIVATKIDKLARGQRIRAMGELESVFHTSVLPVSAVTGEGLDELWKLIDRLANSHNSSRGRRNRPSSSPRSNNTREETGGLLPSGPDRPTKAPPARRARPRR
jgi:GTP-binding protein